MAAFRDAPAPSRRIRCGAARGSFSTGMSRRRSLPPIPKSLSLNRCIDDEPSCPPAWGRFFTAMKKEIKLPGSRSMSSSKGTHVLKGRSTPLSEWLGSGGAGVGTGGRSGIRSRHVHHKTRPSAPALPESSQLFPLHFTIPHKIQIWGEILVQNFRAGHHLRAAAARDVSASLNTMGTPHAPPETREPRPSVAAAHRASAAAPDKAHCSKEVGPRPGIPPRSLSVKGICFSGAVIIIKMSVGRFVPKYTELFKQIVISTRLKPL